MNIKHFILISFFFNLFVLSAFADSELDIINKFQSIDNEHTKIYKIFRSNPMYLPCSSVANPIDLSRIPGLTFLQNTPTICIDENKRPLTGKLIVYENNDIQKKYPVFIADYTDGYPTGNVIDNIREFEMILIYSYQNKKANGESYMYQNNHLEYKWTRKDGEFSGKQISYYPNGNISQEWTNNNGYYGPSIFYEEDGSLFQGNKFLSDCIEANFKDGKLEGKLTAYKSDGDILFEANYEQGVAISGYCNRPISKYATQTEKVEFTNAHLYNLNNALIGFQDTRHYNLETMTEHFYFSTAEILNPCKE